MDGYLTVLSDQLAPSREFISHADQVMDMLFRTLQRCSRFSIDRFVPAGGAEKKTSLGYSVDYDVTAFINDETPPFDDVLDDFQNMILANFDVKEENIKVTSRSVGFKLDDVDFDLLPATNLARSDVGGDTWKKQFDAMVHVISTSEDKRKAATNNSPGLTETAVEFVKKQSPFVHKVARLAKYWNSTIFYSGSQYGRSYIFELLGIKSAQEEEENNQEDASILRAFRLFLKRIENISQQQVVFTDFYDTAQVRSYILEQKPLLMDPSNPFNNVMHDFNSSAQEVFSQYARVSLQRLLKVERQIQMNHGFPDFKGLFQPQPILVKAGPEMKLPKPVNWLVGSRSRDQFFQPDLKVRKASLDSDKYALSNIKKILSAFLFVANLEAQHKGADKKESAKESIQETIDDLFFGSRRTWTSSQDSHENYDVTFEIPIGREGGDTLVISSNWN